MLSKQIRTIAASGLPPSSGLLMQWATAVDKLEADLRRVRGERQQLRGGNGKNKQKGGYKTTAADYTPARYRRHKRK